MAHKDEVPDKLKDSAHTIPKDEWEKVRADREAYAQEDTDDIDVPDHEPEDDDFDFQETPDELTREETL